MKPPKLNLIYRVFHGKLEKLIIHDIICSSTSSWEASVLFFAKNDNASTLCTAYRAPEKLFVENNNPFITQT